MVCSFAVLTKEETMPMKQLTKNRKRDGRQEIVKRKQPPEEFPRFTADKSSAETSAHEEKHSFIVDWQVDKKTD